MKSRSLIVSAHQPNFMPYLGFFDKMQKSDILVIRDEVLYVKKEFHNRNRIRINGNDLDNSQSKWVNVPVEDPKDYIMYAKIKNDSLWNERILQTIKLNYDKAPFFEEYFPELEKIFSDRDDNLLSINMKLIRFFAHAFDIKTKIIMASYLNIRQKNYEKSDASEDLMNICKVLGGDVYLSGNGGRIYLNKEIFIGNGIQLEFQDYEHPTYEQVFPGFSPHMAAIDALFCIGEMPALKKQPILYQTIHKKLG